MKKAITGFLLLAIGGFLTFTSCKKNADLDNSLPSNTTNELKQTSTTSSQKALGNSAQISNLTEGPTGKLEISEDFFNAALNGSFLEGKRTGEHTYLALGPIIQGPPTDPCDQDWIDFYAWYAANYPALRAWATQHCQRAWYGWSGKCINCIMGFVEPDRKNCMGVELEPYRPTEDIFEAEVLIP